jgi:hypothetical protein
MAEILDEFPKSNHGPPGRRYPWEDWFDGRIWKLKFGEDFFVSAPNMRSMIYKAAIERGVRARIHCERPYDVIIVQKKEG